MLNLPKGQDWLLDRMISLGYIVDTDGICEGLSYVSMQAFLINDIERFLTRLQHIADISLADFPTVIQDVQATKVAAFAEAKKEILAEQGYDENEKIDALAYQKIYPIIQERIKKFLPKDFSDIVLEIPAFLDELALLQSPFFYPYLFNNIGFVLSHKLDSVFSLLNPEQLMKEQGLDLLTFFSGSYQKNEIVTYFESFRKIAQENNLTSPISFILKNGNHTIHIGYDYQKTRWFYYDPNHSPIYFNHENDLSEKLLEGFAVNENPNEIAVFSTQMYCTKTNSEHAQEIAQKWQQSKAWQILHDINVYPNKIHQTDPHGWSWLHCLAELGNVTKMQELIDQGADINQQTFRKKLTPLHIATQHGQANIVDTLITSGADVNREDNKGRNALYQAAFYDHVEIAKKLVAANVNINMPNSPTTALYVASYNGCANMVSYLLELGADINQPSSKNRTPLYAAAMQNRLAIVKLLLTHGANPNKANEEGFSPLFTAAQIGSFEVVKDLIETNADVNQTNRYGSTPLFSAIPNNHTQIVQYLIEHGADVNHLNQFGGTPIFVAAQEGQAKAAKILLEHGANINISIEADTQILTEFAKKQDCLKAFEAVLKSQIKHETLPQTLAGFTPLHAAIFFGHANIVQQLIEKGANLNAAFVGIRPIQLAQIMKHQSIVDLLQPYVQTKAKRLNFFSESEQIQEKNPSDTPPKKRHRG